MLEKKFLLLFSFLLLIGLWGVGASAGQDTAAEQRVTITKIIFSGQSEFSAQTLTEIVQPHLNEALTLSDLQALADEVTRYYHDRGFFLAQVIIPEQDIEAGVITFQVLEGWLDQLIIVGNKRYSEQYIRDAFSRLQPGKAINKSVLEKALLALNQSSKLTARCVLKAGSQTGSTDIIVNVMEGDKFDGNIELTNFGATTSKYRLSAGLNWDNVTGRGDVFAANVGASLNRNTNFSYFRYKIPIVQRGLELNTYVSTGNFLIGEDLAFLELNGNSHSWGLGASYPYWLSTQKVVKVEAWFESKDAYERMFGMTTSEDKIRKLRIGLTYDASFRGGHSTFATDLHLGLGELFGAMPCDSPLSSRAFARADNEFSKLTADYTRVGQISPRLSFLAHFSGQKAFFPLVASEQWSIGGANSVRGHAESDCYGDDGYTVNLETRVSLPGQNNYLVFFADHGKVYVYRPTIGLVPDQTRSGLGIGARLNWKQKFSLRLDWGFPIDSKSSAKPIVYIQAKFNY